MEQRPHFILVSSRAELSQWLVGALKEEGEVIVADAANVDRVVQLIDAIGARLVFSELSSGTSSQDAAFMEGLTAAKPLLPVIAMADTPDRNTILTALRAGARDFVSPDMRAGEMVGLVRRILSREPVNMKANATPEGQMTAVASARPGGDSPMFALHLALALQEAAPDQQVLLLDLGVPAADSLHYLGLTPTYSFVDAIRSLRRLDETLIETAFAQHESGLRLLAMPEDMQDAGHFTSADLFVLVGTLRRHFAHVVVNLGGLPASEFLFVMLGRANRTMLLVEQSVPSCKQNRSLLQKLRDNKVNLDNVSLIVDRYLSSVPPSADTIAKGFGLPLLTTLPSSGMARLTMMNSGESLFKSAPRDPYTTTVRKLALNLVGQVSAADRTKASATPAWLQKALQTLHLA